MRLCAAFCIAATALSALAPAALARSPLKRADMKTIRKDAESKAVRFKSAYGAAASHVSCREVTLYVARCKIRLRGAEKYGGGRHDCTVQIVYVVTRDHRIAVDLTRDGCA